MCGCLLTHSRFLSQKTCVDAVDGISVIITVGGLIRGQKDGTVDSQLSNECGQVTTCDGTG